MFNRIKDELKTNGKNPRIQTYIEKRTNGQRTDGVIKGGVQMDLLRKKDLHPAVGVAKSTVADWIEDFSIYIPQLKKVT